MITSSVKQLPKSTVEIEIQISWDEIKSSYEKIIQAARKEIEIEGFRKGKAPQKLTESKIDRNKVYEEVIKEIIPRAYAKAIKDHNLAPIISPKIDIIKAKEEQDWIVKVTVALKPKILLKNYQDKIRALKQSNKKIWTPGSTNEKKPDEKLSLDKIVETLLSEIEIELPDILIEEEINRLLASLIDQTQKLGLTIEKYLQAKGKTVEQIRAEYAQQAEKNLKIEFALSEIADKENITVTATDLDNIISKVEKPEEREKLKKESYYLAHLLRQQKTLDFLNSL
ncbi:hypothetical protein FJY90_07395 [Candidatus Gottesmanbacteria bacterium]|nr:hypothetical protein [Candidatus Gottesmanbacteria bacterium]